MIAHVKIQFEINSQHGGSNEKVTETCDCSRKNTIWNQFTTTNWLIKIIVHLWLLT